MSRRIGVAVAGLGVGETLARSFQQLDTCSVLSLLDLDREKAVAGAAQFPGATVAKSYEELLANPDVDVVVVATYDHAHADQVVAALRAGKNLFVEKPLCVTPEELERIRAAHAGAQGCILSSNLVLRAAPLYQWLQREVRRGAFGRLYAFDGEYLYGRLDKIVSGWRGRSPHYSGMKGGGVHLIDLMLWISGETPVSVRGHGNRICTASSGFDHDDFIAATLTFSSGLVGRVTANLGCVHPHHHVLRIYGTEATFLYDDQGPRILRSRDPGRVAESLNIDPLPPSKGALIPGFVRALSDGSPAEPRADEIFRTMQTVFAIETSLREDRTVSLATA